MPRAKLHLTKAELTSLKEAAGRSVAGRSAPGSITSNVTSNEALSAALLVALADCPLKGKGLFKADRPAVVAMFVRALGKGALRGHPVRVNEVDQEISEKVAGNFTWMVDRRTPKPACEMSFGEAVDLFTDMGDEWRDEARSAKSVESCVLFHRTPDLTGWWHEFEEPEDDLGMPDLQINNQSGYPLADVRFGPGALVGLQPWHSHGHVHVVAAPTAAAVAAEGLGGERLGGGVDVYLPKAMHPELGSAAFKERLMKVVKIS